MSALILQALEWSSNIRKPIQLVIFGGNLTELVTLDPAQRKNLILADMADKAPGAPTIFFFANSMSLHFFKSTS